MNRNSLIINFVWRLAERCGAQFVSFVVSIVLARMLHPDVYGTVALVMAFTLVMDVFVSSGLGSALIQKKEADDIDFSTVFIFNVLFCIILYSLLYLCAPVIADFYDIDDMTLYLRVLGLTIIISGVKNVQVSYISKQMLFKKFFYATLLGTIISAVLGITLAINGGGIWALIIQYLSNNLIDTIVLWFSTKWRPKLVFCFHRLKKLYSYGWKLLVSSLIVTVYDNLRSLLIGKIYTEADLAYYNRGTSLPRMLIDNVNSSLNSVLFPAMAQCQNDKIVLKKVTRRTMQLSIYIIAPILIGLFTVSEPTINFLLTQKWLKCVPFLRIACITMLFYPLHTANLNALKAMGRSDLFLKLEIAKQIVGLIALAITIPISVMAMGYSLLFTSVAGQIINSWPNKKLMNYGYLEQLKDILPGILLAVVMGFCIYPIQWLGFSDIVTLLISVPLGAVIYIGGSILFKLDSFQYIWAIAKPILTKLVHKKWPL